MSKKIEILCAVTCTYDTKKLAIVCPVGKLVEIIENFDAKYLASRFSQDIDRAYPVEALVEIDQMIAPIVNRFGKIPDKSYATIAGIRCAETGEDLPLLKRQIDEIYEVEDMLKNSGFKTYGVYYVEHNIEEFTDMDDVPFSEDCTLFTIDNDKFDIEGFISYIINNFNLMNLKKSPKLYNECLVYNDCSSTKSEINLEFINEFYKEVEEGSLYIPFALQKKENLVSLGNGQEIEIKSTNSGELVFDDYNEYGISIDLIENQYKINAVENIVYEQIDSISIIEDGAEITLKLIETIEKFRI